MKRLVSIISVVLALSICLCSVGLTAFAENGFDTPADDPIEPSPYQYSIYVNTDPNADGTKIYTGVGSAKWLHISPWTTPSTFEIRMYDYSGERVWKEIFTATETTHWYIGANVQYVYLKGGPSAVDVWATNN